MCHQQLTYAIHFLNSNPYMKLSLDEKGGDIFRERLELHINEI